MDRPGLLSNLRLGGPETANQNVDQPLFDPSTDPPAAPAPPSISIHVPSAEDIAHAFLDGLMGLLGDFVQNGMHAGENLLQTLANSPLNIYTRTPPELTYAHPAVVDMFGQLRLVALGTLAFLFVVAGFIHMAAPVMGGQLPIRTLAVRAGFAVALSATSLLWGAKFVDMVNALDAAVMAAPLGSIILPFPNGFDPVQWIAALFYAVALIYLLLKMAMRIVWLLILLAIAPVALILWVVPQLGFVATGWGRQFFGNLFGQPLTLIVIRLGAAVLGGGHDPSPLDYFLGAGVFLVALQMPVWFSLLALGSRSGGMLSSFAPSRLLPFLAGASLPVRAAAWGARAAAQEVSIAKQIRGVRQP